MLKIYEIFRALAEQQLGTKAFYAGQIGGFYKYDETIKDYVYREIVDPKDVPYINFYIASELEFRNNPAIIQLQCVLDYRCNTDVKGLGMLDTQNAGIYALRSIIRGADAAKLKLSGDISYTRVARSMQDTMQSTGIMASFTIIVSNYIKDCC